MLPNKVTPILVDDTKVVVTKAGFVIRFPFKVSFTSTLVNEVPPVAPLIEVPLSLLAIIGAAPTGTVTIASSQFKGLRTSHIL